jgi:hypothetical protein
MNDLSNEALEIKDPHRLKRDLSRVLFPELPDDTPQPSPSIATAPLVPNKPDIAAHLYALFSPAFVQPYPDAWLEIAYCSPDGAITDAQNYSVFELEEAVEFAEARNAAGDNLYVGPALRQGKQPGSGRAKGEHVLTSAYAWAEYDEAGDDKRIADTLKANNLKPALVVTTGTVPHPRRHLYFKIDGAVTKEKLEAANTALMILLGSDAVQDANRILRLAGTVSHPSTDKKGRGYNSELTTLRRIPDAPAYKIDALIGLAPAPGTTADDHIAEYGKGAAGRTDAEVMTLLEKSKIENWHNNILSAIPR